MNVIWHELSDKDGLLVTDNAFIGEYWRLLDCFDLFKFNRKVKDTQIQSPISSSEFFIQLILIS